jgi:hypothetical protein
MPNNEFCFLSVLAVDGRHFLCWSVNAKRAGIIDTLVMFAQV